MKRTILTGLIVALFAGLTLGCGANPRIEGTAGDVKVQTPPILPKNKPGDTDIRKPN